MDKLSDKTPSDNDMSSIAHQLNGEWSGYEICRMHHNRRQITLKIEVDGHEIHATALLELSSKVVSEMLVSGLYDMDHGKVTLNFAFKDKPNIHTGSYDGWHRKNTIYGEWTTPDAVCCGSFRLRRGGISDEDIDQLFAKEVTRRTIKVDAVATAEV